MSSASEKDQTVDNGDGGIINSCGTPQLKKPKKKKKLRIFSFRSKKTKSTAGNVLTTEQSDSVSLCSELSAMEGGNVLAETGTYTEKHAIAIQSSQRRSLTVPSRTEFLTANDTTTLSVPEDDTTSIVRSFTEDDDHVKSGRHSTSHLPEHRQASSPQPELKAADIMKKGTGKAADNCCDGLHLCMDSSDDKLSRSFRLKRSLKEQSQRVLNQISYNSSTDGSSYPASPARRWKRKSKKVKMPSIVGATHQLIVRLLSGESLAARDINGLSDPYVKFKVDGRTVYKSRVCKSTCNPKWEREEFTIHVNSATEIFVRVFDRDIGTRDDFMGTSSFCLHSLIENEETELSLDLESEHADEEEELGRIHLAAMIVPLADQVERITLQIESPEGLRHAIPISRSGSNASDVSRTGVSKWRKPKQSVGSAVVQLVSGQRLLTRDSGSLADPYVKLQMGKQRQKSKICSRTFNPVWREEFNFQLFGQESLDHETATCLEISVWDRDSYRKDDFMGRCELDLGSLEYDKTHFFSLALTDAPGSLTLLVTLHSCLPKDEPPERKNFANMSEKYSLSSTFSDVSDVGFAEVKIMKATGCKAGDFGGRSDPFCVVELCNARAQTHTCYKTSDPVWNKTVRFPIKDIHDVFYFTVYNEDKGHNDFLGRLAIPLLRVVNGSERTYALKGRKLLTQEKRTLTVQITFTYNQARAAIRTFSPRERKLMENPSRFKRHLLLNNFGRVWSCLQAVFQQMEFVDSCFTWKNPWRSAISFIVYLLLVWNFELYMLPILLLLLLAKNYFEVFVQKTKVDRRLAISSSERLQDDNEDGDDGTEDSNHKVSLIRRLKAVEEVLLKVQNILDFVANLLERIHNTFMWSVPFLSTLAVIVLSVVVVILYLVPLRIIALLWGVNKFTKRLREPDCVSNNELLDFISRVPSEVELNEFQEFPVCQSSPRNSKKKR